MQINLQKNERLVGVMVQFNCSENRNDLYSLAAIGFRFHVSNPISHDMTTISYKQLAPTFDHSAFIKKTEIFGNKGAPVYRTWPSDELLSEISPGMLADWSINKVTWLARGGLDALKFHSSSGMESFYMGYPDPSNWRPGGKITYEMSHNQLKSANIGNTRKIQIWMQKERQYITGLAFTDDCGREIIEKGNHTHGGPTHTINLNSNQALIGF